MKNVLFRSSAYLLLLAVLFMVGAAMSASVSHDLQHAAHHTAASHSKGVCAWMCATGGIAHQAWPSLSYAPYEAESISVPRDRSPSVHLTLKLASRAPPIHIA